MTSTLNLVGACATLGLGLLGLFAPARAAAFVGLTHTSPEGASEFRATYGGFFMALGVVALVSSDPIVFAAIACAWIAAALGRVVSILLDSALTAKNIAAIGFEAGIGMALLIGEPGSQLQAVIAAIGPTH